jgi:hypothetical protein
MQVLPTIFQEGCKNMFLALFPGLLKFFEHNEKMTIDITNLAASLHSLTGGSYSVFIPVSECGSKR